MAPHEHTPLVTSYDVKKLIAYAGGYALTSVVPQQFDSRLVEGAARLTSGLRKIAGSEEADTMQRLLGPRFADADLRRVVDANVRMRLESALGRFRGLHRAGWDPLVKLEGVDEIRSARADGRGVILWRMRFCDATVVNAALWRAGIWITHLSVPWHGANRSRLGICCVSPLHARGENWYLGERVLIPLDGSPAYMRILRDRLNAGGTISIFAEARGRRVATTRVLGMDIAVATGAPSLARSTGAVLLTTHAVREGPQRYRAIIDRPIEVDPELPRAEFAQQAVHEFGRRLEKCLVERPDCWTRWYDESTYGAKVRSLSKS